MSQDELSKSKVPDPEVVPPARRRRFNAGYKSRILEEAGFGSEPGGIRALVALTNEYCCLLGDTDRKA